LLNFWFGGKAKVCQESKILIALIILQIIASVGYTIYEATEILMRTWLIEVWISAYDFIVGIIYTR
jgi:hypothetical protein